ncbi:hypothetical protein Ocin01_06939 [Orchesella cincta]|uniref:Uncharacterized protein n=1 Tax=Orchesella cincta TaxID=48709 RepID=A0A1D2N3A4_ORCCI|nr:hypothetical protein Ocin01_06939 [Orchesella cincta]
MPDYTRLKGPKMPKSKYVPMSGNLHLHAGLPAQFRKKMVHPDYAYQRRCVKTMVYEMQARNARRHNERGQASSPSSGSGSNNKRGTFSKIWDRLKHPFRYFKRSLRQATTIETATMTTTCSLKTNSDQQQPNPYCGVTYQSIRKGRMQEVGRVEKVQSWITEMQEPTVNDGDRPIIAFP